jgi:hypothetical protein
MRHVVCRRIIAGLTGYSDRYDLAKARELADEGIHEARFVTARVGLDPRTRSAFVGRLLE